MAFLTIDVYSHVLGMDVPISVLLPEKRKYPIDDLSDTKYPVLYLLHGHSDDHTSWIRKSKIERLVRNYKIIIVMPYVHRGFYTDCKYGYHYFTFIQQELPKIIANHFHASTKREDTFVAGNSMGGYGALKLAITHPEQYSKAASFSGVVMPLPQLLDEDNNDIFNMNDFTTNIHNIFGNEKQFVTSINDLKYQIEKLDSYNGNKPMIYQCCGQQDSLVYKQNVEFHDFILSNTTNLNYVYDESIGGHDWDYWDPNIEKFIKMLNLKNN